MKTLVIVLGHGSRAPEHNNGLQQVVEMVRQMTDLPVEFAYMENCQPDLGTAIRKAATQGYHKCVIMPLFLFKGIHVAEDVPKEIEAIKQELPQIEIVFARHLGADPKIAQIVWERVQEVI